MFLEHGCFLLNRFVSRNYQNIKTRKQRSLLSTEYARLQNEQQTLKLFQDRQDQSQKMTVLIYAFNNQWLIINIRKLDQLFTQCWKHYETVRNNRLYSSIYYVYCHVRINILRKLDPHLLHIVGLQKLYMMGYKCQNRNRFRILANVLFFILML